MKDDEVVINRGLQGVYTDHTETTFIDGQQGVLEYRGYNIDELAKYSTFEETSYLLLYGELPTAQQLNDLDSQFKESRGVPQQIYDLITIVKDSHPMDVLRTAVSALSDFDPDRNDDSAEAIYRKGIRLTSQVSTIIMAHHNIKNGRDAIPPNTSLGHAANFLYMFKGETPDEQSARLMDTDFVVHADHGLNASAFTARVVTGTKADMHSAVSAAIAALSGPSHGGAAENVIQMAREIGEPSKAAEYVRNLIDNRQRVMGFGHRVYRTEDPRARHIEDGLKTLSGQKEGAVRWYKILLEVRNAMKPYAKRGIHPNVDFFAGIVYHLLGLPQELFVPIFAAGRIPGWTIQIVEQSRQNILIRPLLLYTGPRAQTYIPIDER